MIEKGHALLLYSCNAWHEHSSKELLGVFTDNDSFIDYISDMKSSGQLSEETTEGLLRDRQTQGLEENYMIEEEMLNPALSV